jgi:hypothetical protein
MPVKKTSSKHGSSSPTPAPGDTCKGSTSAECATCSPKDSSPCQGQIEITPKNYRSLKTAYDYAVCENAKDFVWQNKVLVTSYAKYVLEHMRNMLKIAL